MDAGKLDRRITLQRRTLTQSTMGDVQETWENVATVWARRLSSKGREFYSGGVSLGVEDAGFQIRYSVDVSAIDQTCRIIFDGANYDIFSIDENGRKGYLTILAKRGASAG